jgi:hypothetical protein
VSILATAVRNKGERRYRPPNPGRNSNLAQYLLSVHSVEGEVSAPMTDDQVQQSYQQIGRRLGPLRPPAWVAARASATGRSQTRHRPTSLVNVVAEPANGVVLFGRHS